ncbi:carotenoid oxygenase [Verminephrobacter aporrectodeae subsp. tuberculatae]|uniref:carotenoid oxygenase family protein n=1 Tax=Verminephrobacter aporrectodeae TaxID=1110389 RepID=UPI0022433028|nr:carotenoid oxygenase family protein [Verminephrobacter aporrectodeae]MCW8196872.1 carotenoid oxygenase [Verminephrobacter aporrectodeae subsp. tuberculatae]
MERRELLRLLAGALPLLAPLARAASTDDWQALFEASTVPWKTGYATPPGDLPLTRASVRGRFPDAVTGTLLRIGPAGHDLGGERYHHWFDGDGMLHRFVIDGTDVRHQGRYVATPKRVAELRAGRRLFEAFGSILPGVEPPTSPDSLNAANTSVLPLRDELLALWEGGSATRIDARTLDTLGPKTWRADLAGMPFSAHPKVDPDGTVWNFGLGSGQQHGLLALYEIAPEGRLRRAAVVPVADLPMVHDFAVTERHLVFLLPPLVYDGKRREAGASLLDAHVWRPELGMRALVVEKRDWDKRQMLALPAGFLFHVGNAWEEDTPRGTRIHLDYARTDNADPVFTTLREVMRARLVRNLRPQLSIATLNLGTGQATQQTLPLEAEFPRIDPRRVGLRHRHVVHATQVRPDLPGFGAVARTNVENGRSQRFSYGAQAIVEEHVFIPDGTRPGWVLGTAFDFGRQKTLLSCFAADHLAAGPVAQATLAYALPLGLHGAFIPG